MKHLIFVKVFWNSFLKKNEKQIFVKKQKKKKKHIFEKPGPARLAAFKKKTLANCLEHLERVLVHLHHEGRPSARACCASIISMSIGRICGKMCQALLKYLQTNELKREDPSDTDLWRKKYKDYAVNVVGMRPSKLSTNQSRARATTQSATITLNQSSFQSTVHSTMTDNG